MKKDPLSKLYQQMNSQELALLAFANLKKEDSLEHTRIVDAVPRCHYLCLDTTFTNYLHMAVKGIVISTVIGLTDRDEEQESALLDFHEELMAAVEVALIEICDEFRIDINAVRQIAGITRVFKQENTPNAEYLQEVKGCMREVLIPVP